MLELLRKCKQRGLFLHPPGERLLRKLAVSDIVLDANRVKELSYGIADARGRHRRPKMAAILAVDALLDGISLDFTHKLTMELIAIFGHILGKRFLKNRSSKKLRSRIARQTTKLLIDPQHSTILVDLDNASTDMLIGCGKPLVSRAQPIVGARMGTLQRSATDALMEAVDCTGRGALFVEDRRDMQDGPDVRSVGSLYAALDSADGNTRP